MLAASIMKSVIFALVTIGLSAYANAQVLDTSYKFKLQAISQDGQALFLNSKREGSMLETSVLTAKQSDGAVFTANCPEKSFSQWRDFGKFVVPLEAFLRKPEVDTTILPIYFGSIPNDKYPNSWGFDCDNYLTWNKRKDVFVKCTSLYVEFLNKESDTVCVLTAPGIPISPNCVPITLKAVFE